MDDPLPSHVEWLADRMGGRIEAELARQGDGRGSREALRILCEADPTPGRLAVQWLAERLLEGGLLWEDVRSGAGSKAHETLVAFGTHRKALPIPERNLASHRTLASAWRAVAHMLPVPDVEPDGPGSRELRRRERAEVRSESIILCEREGLTVAVPLTERASKWWGRGTRWCTAADNDNRFDCYNVDGPLIVVVLPSEKLQLALDTFGEGVAFRDASDEVVGPETAERHWNAIGPLVRWALRRKPCLNLIRCVPQLFHTREMYLDALRLNGAFLPRLPGAREDREMCLAAISSHPGMLDKVPYDMRDAGMCDAALRLNGGMLACVPPGLRTRERCMAAVQSNGSALDSVPIAMRDQDMCVAAVWSSGYALRSVPTELRDRSTCLMAFETRGGSLEDVPVHLRDSEMCMAAVRKESGKALEHVPEALRDKATCLAAVAKDGMSIVHVPIALKDREMCLAAVARSGLALSHVPGEIVDVEMCCIAVGQDKRARPFVPTRFKDALLYSWQWETRDPAIDALLRQMNERKWSPEVTLRGLAEALAIDAASARPDIGGPAWCVQT